MRDLADAVEHGMSAKPSVVGVKPVFVGAACRRWWGLLSVSVQNTFAATLLGSPPIAAAMPGAQAHAAWL